MALIYVLYSFIFSNFFPQYENGVYGNQISPNNHFERPRLSVWTIAVCASLVIVKNYLLFRKALKTMQPNDISVGNDLLTKRRFCKLQKITENIVEVVCLLISASEWKARPFPNLLYKTKSICWSPTSPFSRVEFPQANLSTKSDFPHLVCQKIVIYHDFQFWLQQKY